MSGFHLYDTLTPIILLSHGTVFPVLTFGADSGRCAAREPRGACCLVSAGAGSFSVCAAENPRTVQGCSRNKFGWLGHIPEPGRDCAICNHCVSEAQGETPLASAQPIDRYLCLYRRHPGSPTRVDGVHHCLSVCRTVRQFCGHFRSQFSPTEPGGSQRCYRQRTGRTSGTRTAGNRRVAGGAETARSRMGPAQNLRLER